MRSLGLAPLTADQRTFIRKSGAPKLSGVLPVELRVVLERLRDVHPQLDPMERKTFVDRELLKFVAAAQPPKAVLGNIFANAQASSVRLASADGVSALKCACCGAARPAGADLRTCTFCGTAFF